MPAPSIQTFGTEIFKLNVSTKLAMPASGKIPNFDKTRNARFRENSELRHSQFSLKKASQILSKHFKFLKI
jgi:hypothetical protein